MLLGPNCVAITNSYRLSGQDSADNIGDQPVPGPVTSTDNITCPDRGGGNPMTNVFTEVEAGRAVGARQQFLTHPLLFE